MTDLLAESRPPRMSLPFAAAVTAARPVAIGLTAVLVGALLVTWLSEAALATSSELWVEYHQAVTPAYTRALPPIGGLALLAAVGASRVSQVNRRLVLAAVSCLLIGLVLTMVVHVPINADIASWRPVEPPAQWQEVRSRWLAAHAVRSALTIGALGLLVAAGLERRGAAHRAKAT